ncbi:hypothetical protein TNCV_1271791 [Trichonephila clavipes]|nr:hypothetical protein TNCV_1271791 [Trichonephila clavipes]
MDDSATCHRTLAVLDCLDSEGIQRLVWPARSPDLNPIENVWDALGRQVAGRNYPPTNKNTLIRALTEEWDKLPQQLLDNVVQIEIYEQGILKISTPKGSCILTRELQWRDFRFSPLGLQTTATAGSDVVQSGRPIFDDFFQHLSPYIGNNTENVVLQRVKRLWLIRIDQ